MLKCTNSLANPCLLIKTNKHFRNLIFMSYVDDTMIIGTPERQEWYKTTICKYFSIRETQPLITYISVKITKTDSCVLISNLGRFTQAQFIYFSDIITDACL